MNSDEISPSNAIVSRAIGWMTGFTFVSWWSGFAFTQQERRGNPYGNSGARDGHRTNIRYRTGKRFH